ncbi:unnamed protein product [Brassica rapa subsp. narinosa]|uniref:(rape) hypothetical protein n=1 Tax=Brassica napus TaxID=3708 RepID=A0A816Y5Y7_BRANA|nr:unnamed protein product [Brassica napus]
MNLFSLPCQRKRFQGFHQMLRLFASRCELPRISRVSPKVLLCAHWPYDWETSLEITTNLR